MTDVKLSEIPVANAVEPTDLIYGVVNNVSRAIPAEMLFGGAVVAVENIKIETEAARDAAIEARDSASGHRLNAQNAQVAANEARVDSQAARDDSEAARDAAQGFAGDGEASADLAQAWAEGTEPGGAGTKSSREHAEDAAASAATFVGTDLDITGSGNTRTITSSTGTDVTIPVATTSTAGWMSTQDKTKLDGVANNATANITFTSVPALLTDDNAIIGYAGSGAQFEVQEGDEVTAGGYRYLVADSSATGADIVETAGGVKLKARADGFYNVQAFGAFGDGVADDTLAIQRALDAGSIIIPDGAFLIDAGGLSWPDGHEIKGSGTLVRAGTPTAPCLLANTAGTFRISGVTFDDGGHFAQAGMIEADHAGVKLYVSDVFAHNGYAGIWAKQASIVDISGGEYWDTSHNLYFGDNSAANLPGTIERVTVRGVVSRNARAGGDGLKTVSGVKRLTVIGGRYYGNAFDGIDLFAGCDEAMLIGVECFGNTVNGVDIKTGNQATYPYAAWGQRRRISILGGYYNDNAQVGIKIFGEPAEGYFQDVLVQGANIIGNQIYGIQCRGVAPRILGNLLLGNATSSAANYAVIFMHGDTTTKPKGGVVAHNTIGNNGVFGRTNAGINVIGWDSLLIDGNIIGNTADREEAQELDWGIAVDANSSGIHIVNNQMGALNNFRFNIAAGSSILGINPGVALKTKGTLTIASGSTSGTANHNAAGRPAAFTQVRFFPLGTQAGSGFPFPGATSTTQITANVATAPTSNITIGWEVDLTDETNTFAILA